VPSESESESLDVVAPDAATVFTADELLGVEAVGCEPVGSSPASASTGKGTVVVTSVWGSVTEESTWATLPVSKASISSFDAGAMPALGMTLDGA
jgi:hypothetical protein